MVDLKTDAAVNGENNPKEDDRKIFIGGLGYNTVENDLKEYFTSFGEVENVNLKKDPVTGRSRGFAFVLFSSVQAVDKVIDAGQHTINGKTCDPKRAKMRSGKVFVGGLNAEISDDDVRNHFGQYGKIVDIEMPFDKQKNQRKGFCFVVYEAMDTVKAVLKTSSEATINGKKVDIKRAIPRANDPWSFPYGGPTRGGFRGRGGRGGYYEPYGGGYGYGDYYGYGYDGYGYDYGNYGGYNYGNYEH